MCVQNDWDKAVKFHGHSCVGLALGYRAGKAALQHLGSKRSPDEELVAIVETDNCAVDALQVLTGCTMGKGNIVFCDYGKNAFTIGRRETGEAVRVVARDLDDVLGGGYQQLRGRAMGCTASESEMQLFQEIQVEAPQRILDADEDLLFKIERVQLDFPARARIFSSVACSSCGEHVMEPRARLRNGKLVCIPCSELYAPAETGRGRSDIRKF
jgi:formylmethanofuran dehydrogenase subunit E